MDTKVKAKAYGLDDLTKLARVYVKIRTAKAAATSEHKKKDEEFKQQMETIEAALLQAVGKLKSARTEDGLSVIKTLDIIPHVTDWDAFYKWIGENDAYEALERRVKKQFIKEYREEHKDDPETSCPPGVRVIEEFKIQVRKGE